MQPVVCNKDMAVVFPLKDGDCEFWLEIVDSVNDITNPSRDHAYVDSKGLFYIYNGKEIQVINDHANLKIKWGNMIGDISNQLDLMEILNQFVKTISVNGTNIAKDNKKNIAIQVPITTIKLDGNTISPVDYIVNLDLASVYAKKTEIPKNVSELQNDAGYIKQEVVDQLVPIKTIKVNNVTIPPDENHTVNIENVYVTPEMFGAYGDGEHDDTVAIQSAINNAYKIVFSPNKTYLIEGKLIIYSGKELIGNGCTIHKPSTTTLHSEIFNLNKVKSVSIRGFELTSVRDKTENDHGANITGSNVDGFFVHDCEDILFENISCDGLSQDFWMQNSSDYTGESKNITIINWKSRNGTNCMYSSKSDNLKIVGADLKNADGITKFSHALYLERDNKNVIITDSIFSVNDDNSSEAMIECGTSYDTVICKFSFSNCRFILSETYNGNRPFNIGPTSFVNVDNCYFDGIMARFLTNYICGEINVTNCSMNIGELLYHNADFDTPKLKFIDCDITLNGNTAFNFSNYPINLEFRGCSIIFDNKTSISAGESSNTNVKFVNSVIKTDKRIGFSGALGSNVSFDKCIIEISNDFFLIGNSFDGYRFVDTHIIASDSNFKLVYNDNVTVGKTLNSFINGVLIN